MILSLKERFRQSIVATILFIKVMITIHTMIIYITCKKTNWCTFGLSYLNSAPFSISFAKKSYHFDTTFFIQTAGLAYHHALTCISSALWAVYHHRRCIPLRLDDILARKRDILVFGRMIYTFCESDLISKPFFVFSHKK